MNFPFSRVRTVRARQRKEVVQEFSNLNILRRDLRLIRGDGFKPAWRRLRLTCYDVVEERTATRCRLMISLLSQFLTLRLVFFFLNNSIAFNLFRLLLIIILEMVPKSSIEKY